MGQSVNPIHWEGQTLKLLDQRILPHEEVFEEITNLERGHWAIKEMVVRGAPCIGFTAIYSMALAAKESNHGKDIESFKKAGEYLKTARPTAVNLEFEVENCLKLGERLDSESRFDALFDELVKMGHEKMEKAFQDNLTMAKIAEKELDSKLGKTEYSLMHHCNTGFLACGCLGTALGVISCLHTQKKIKQALVDETRPYLQGSRLSSFELLKEGVPHKIVVEGAASYLMRENLVDAIFVGADRITLNGDVANKVGTSTAAIVAKHYGVPFYVVAPTSSFDLNAQTGKDIKIELRDQEEILSYKGTPIAPKGAEALNPSFDITENSLIEGIICEKGIIKAPYLENLEKIVRS